MRGVGALDHGDRWWHRILCVTAVTAGSLCFGLVVPPWLAAGPMETDPNGFSGFQWGMPLADQPALTEVASGKHVHEYEMKDKSPVVRDIEVESLRLVTINRQFARVVIRYHGNPAHDHMLEYLQSLFGPVERLPGSMMRGLNQQFTWRGPHTEVNLTYDRARERGTVFIESRTLAPRFNDVLPEHAF